MLATAARNNVANTVPDPEPPRTSHKPAISTHALPHLKRTVCSVMIVSCCSSSCAPAYYAYVAVIRLLAQRISVHWAAAGPIDKLIACAYTSRAADALIWARSRLGLGTVWSSHAPPAPRHGKRTPSHTPANATAVAQARLGVAPLRSRRPARSRRDLGTVCWHRLEAERLRVTDTPDGHGDGAIWRCGG